MAYRTDGKFPTWPLAWCPWKRLVGRTPLNFWTLSSCVYLVAKLKKEEGKYYDITPCKRRLVVINQFFSQICYFQKIISTNITNILLLDRVRVVDVSVKRLIRSRIINQPINEPSSTLLSSWVTLTASRSILACKELALSLNPWASLASSPNRSSACLDKLDSCLIVLANVPFVTASNSEGRGKFSGMVPRATSTGSTSRLGSGIFFLLERSPLSNYLQ